MADVSEDMAYRLLSKAIVLQAAQDYGRALLGQHAPNYTPKERAFYNKSMVRECERFFNSEDYLMYTDIPGVAIIDEIREQVKTWPSNKSFVLGNII